MHVALVLTQSLESPSGLGRYWPVARELVRLGYRVSVIAPHHDWTPAVPRHVVRDGVDVWCTGQMHVHKTGSRKEYFSLAQLLRVSLQGAINSARLIRFVRPDVIHLGKPQPINGLAARWVMLFNRRWPLVVDCDDLEAESNRTRGAWQRRILAYFEDSLPKQARAVTVNTRFMQERLEKLGLASSRIVYVPNGVDRQRFATASQFDRVGEWLGTPASTKRVLYLGSLELINHPMELLLDALAMVHRSESQSSLLIVGGGSDWERLQKLLTDRHQVSYIRLVGRVPASEAGAYYRAAHVSVDPVYDDRVARARSPLKIVESLAVGTPVVTADVGDRRWMLEPNHAGVLVIPGSAPALANGILSILSDNQFRQQLQLGALIARDRFWWDVIIKEWVKVYSI